MQENNKNIYNIKNAKFYLPNYPKDSISRIMVDSNDYWDNWSGGALPIINRYLKNNSVILDIGANVGSHTVYWAIERSAKKIYSFEPFLETFDILKKNIELNALEDKVTLYNLGLSNENCSMSVSKFTPLNVGATSFEKNNDGEFKFVSLDSIDIPDKIDMVKIDVEGSELDVLEGARQTLLKNTPVIVIETLNKDKVEEFMNSIGYILADVIRDGEDYIYIPINFANVFAYFVECIKTFFKKK